MAEAQGAEIAALQAQVSALVAERAAASARGSGGLMPPLQLYPPPTPVPHTPLLLSQCNGAAGQQPDAARPLYR